MRNPVMRINVKPRRGFTLVELLIVVAILALLISIMLPSLSKAREQTKRVMCRNNLRSIWTGILTYSLEFNDRVPFMEDVNLLDPEADPFDPAYPSTVGNVLLSYVNPGSWVCPSAIAGFPKSAGRGQWKMTYEFSTAGKPGEGVPYDDNPKANSRSPLDPAVSNYVHFDGRPMRLMDGRRYVGFGVNRNQKGSWNVRRSIIADAMGGDRAHGRPKYPHRGAVQVRTDLENYRPTFEFNTFGSGVKPGYFELHADGDKVDVYLTRYWEKHMPGY